LAAGRSGPSEYAGIFRYLYYNVSGLKRKENFLSFIVKNLPFTAERELKSHKVKKE